MRAFLPLVSLQQPFFLREAGLWGGFPLGFSSGVCGL